jgi:hypothetical protein
MKVGAWLHWTAKTYRGSSCRELRTESDRIKEISERRRKSMGSNYEVFLQTLKSSAATPLRGLTAVAPVQTNPIAAEQLVPILSTLARFQSPIPVGTLAIEARLQVTPLVLTLQGLADAGVVVHEASSDSVMLTDLGRQMLAVGKMIPT